MVVRDQQRDGAVMRMHNVDNHIACAKTACQAEYAAPHKSNRISPSAERCRMALSCVCVFNAIGPSAQPSLSRQKLPQPPVSLFHLHYNRHQLSLSREIQQYPTTATAPPPTRSAIILIIFILACELPSWI